eukprot:scaffold3.g6722.t1
MARGVVLLLALIAASGAHAYTESFGEGWQSRWVHSAADKYSGKFVVEKPEGLSDPALKVPEKAKHYGISTALPEPVDPTQDLVLQYDLKLQSGHSCGGAYLKFLTADDAFTPEGLKDDTPYTVMFGPDKCGTTNKVHLIVRHKSPKTGEIEEKHLKFPPAVPFDDKTHVYTAILRASNNSYAVLIDGEEKKAGSLFEDFEPPFNPPETIPDPEDKKPEDWVDDAKIADPAASKPDDWDEDAPETILDDDAKKPKGWLDEEPAEIDDPEATKPEDWDDEEDGEWEPPTVPNPKCKDAPGCGEWVRPTKPNPAYKGKWSAPLIDNPAYKGPRDIPNPAHYKDEAPLSNVGKVGAVAVEVWTMDDGYFFDNVLISNSAEEAAAFAEQTFQPKKEAEDKVEAEKKAKEEAEAKKKKSKPSVAVTESAKSLVDTLFGLPLVRDYATQLAPVRDFLEANPLAVYAVLAAPILLLLPLLLGGSKKAPSADVAAVAKKTDKTGADDKPSASKKGGGNGKKEKEAEGEIEEEEEEEEEGEPSREGEPGGGRGKRPVRRERWGPGERLAAARAGRCELEAAGGRAGPPASPCSLAPALLPTHRADEKPGPRRRGRRD